MEIITLLSIGVNNIVCDYIYNGVYISAQGCRLIRAGDFLAGFHSLFIGQNCRFEQRFTREFCAYKTRDNLHFTSEVAALETKLLEVVASSCQHIFKLASYCVTQLTLA